MGPPQGKRARRVDPISSVLLSVRVGGSWVCGTGLYSAPHNLLGHTAPTHRKPFPHRTQHEQGKKSRPDSGLDLSSEYGINKTVKARFWPWLSGAGDSKRCTWCYLRTPCQSRANSAHIRQSRPDSGLGFQVQVTQNVVRGAIFAHPVKAEQTRHT